MAGGTVRRIIRTEGAVGLFRGDTPNVLRIAPAKSCRAVLLRPLTRSVAVGKGPSVPSSINSSFATDAVDVVRSHACSRVG